MKGIDNTMTDMITLTAPQQVAFEQIANGDEEARTIAKGTMRALIRRGLVEVDPDGLLTLSEDGHARVDQTGAEQAATDAPSKAAGTKTAARATSTKGDAPTVAEKPAEKARTIRISRQVLGYLERLPKGLKDRLAAAEVANDGSKRVAVEDRDLDYLVEQAEAIAKRDDVSRGDVRSANALVTWITTRMR